LDIEKPNRAELIKGLSVGFDCFEEVLLDHALFANTRVRADIIAVPKLKELEGFVFAFEVKVPKPNWGYGHWSQHIKQAHDYLYARVADPKFPELGGLVVSCAFLYPTPPYNLLERTAIDSPYIEKLDQVLASGAFHLGLHFRVGRAFWEKNPPFRRLVLAFGPNDVWNGFDGFVPRGKGLLDGKRSVGSRKIDVLSQLKS
jgi:hypothetical protein